MKEVKQKLEKKIRKLERELQDELPKALKTALEMGDLRENAEYQTAKERQSYVQAELANLKQRLDRKSTRLNSSHRLRSRMPSSA